MKKPKTSDMGSVPDLRVEGDGRPSANVTLTDVARVAGVSPITVSRAINRPDIVSSRTLKQVTQAIERIGYVPNLLAGALRSNRTRLVAAIVPSIGTSMFAEAVEALSDRLSEAGYEVLLGLSGFNQVHEDEILSAALSRKPDAIFLTGIQHSAWARKQLLAARIPVVESWDLTPSPIDMVVGFSHDGSGRAAARHLLSKGYRRFAVIAATDHRALQRRDGFLAELEDQGTKAAVILTHTPGSLELGRNAFAQLLEDGIQPEAVFCTSDPLAQGVIIEGQVRGVSVPGDIAVMGFGDFSFAAHIHPTLSTVRFDRRQIGRIAAEAILAELNGMPSVERIVDIGFTVMEREST
ncbi:LacI family DNA-binding transcriptional regulator [Telmatospirillum sp.]|uniref:LacI family DNA-binding transcriptional regulator n=1 Tax=Telmatospirillum sp. TaxID=2079197 RepID=UPI00284079AA|nr:LacI family DNA-binding transcriptional regulator [Telmatospirillum sp.]MDR3436228.1 LacI family DNA-binding transcriptional regulator [Telmatospirillum sp.]